MLNKARGALYGLAVGDAFGATLEFSDPDEYPDFPQLMTGPHTEVIGQGPFGLRPGQVTDDTMMALCLAGSLVHQRAFDADDVRFRYKAWVKLTHDAGRLTKQALKSSAYEAWEKSGRTSAGNGSLMRCAPIGVYFHGSQSLILVNSLMDSEITHFDPRCTLACVAHNFAINEALTSDTPTPLSMLEAARRGIQVASETYREDEDLAVELKAATRDLLLDLEMAQKDDPLLYDYSAMFGSSDVTEPESADFENLSGLSITGTTMGFVRVSFRLAFWELMHSISFESAMLDTVNRGGDSDTNGAIVGGLLGALYGFEAIPKRWVDPIMACKPGGPFNDIYHPSLFTSLLGIL